MNTKQECEHTLKKHRKFTTFNSHSKKVITSPGLYYSHSSPSLPSPARWEWAKVSPKINCFNPAFAFIAYEAITAQVICFILQQSIILNTYGTYKQNAQRNRNFCVRSCHKYLLSQFSNCAIFQSISPMLNMLGVWRVYQNQKLK